MRTLRFVTRLLLGILFVLAGINHFADPEFYVNLMPDYIPMHAQMVMASGVTEIIAGALLLFRKTAALGAWGIIAMLVVFFTVHIHMIVHAERYPGVPIAILYFRIVLQFLFIAWAWVYTRPEGAKPEEATA